MPHLRKYLEQQMPGRMPKLDPIPYDGRVPTGDKLKRVVDKLLTDRSRLADHVIALTDVYTGTREFKDAADAKRQMREWVGRNDKFHPHAAQHDFEAWLLPYWDDIQKLAGSNKVAPAAAPESVNHIKPPAHHIKEIFLTGTKGKAYVKPRDAGRILRNKDLSIAISQCPELNAFVNTILVSCGRTPIP